MTGELVAVSAGRVMGTVRRDRNGRLSFLCDQGWRTAPGAYPLSHSMPVAVAEHGHRPIEAFLWGLLPDNAMVLDRWARRFQVSARNPFAICRKRACLHEPCRSDGPDHRSVAGAEVRG
ncbi:HipA N-terminal domain-containing protein [Skermanella sp. TT6]|uniref:HipA N-terminal domain-containing protein n=1 Tax=Skermanella cutis TaxID=2775420 RepID=A0ABX7B4U8_9PROT|nr:HipA N-terminal domain-containing protein [Skermanella sp. TT6]